MSMPRWLKPVGVTVAVLVVALLTALLVNGVLVIAGWEQMYSEPAITLYTLWTMFGVALGVATIGVGAILAARPRPEAAQPQRATSREEAHKDHTQ